MFLTLIALNYLKGFHVQQFSILKQNKFWALTRYPDQLSPSDISIWPFLLFYHHILEGRKVIKFLSGYLLKKIWKERKTFLEAFQVTRILAG